MTHTSPTTPAHQTAQATALHLAHSTRPVIPRDRLLRLADVENTTGLRKSSIYALAREGKFPKPINLSRRMSAWSESAVLSWVQDRIQGVQQ